MGSASGVLNSVCYVQALPTWGGIPLLLTAQGCGVQLAQHIVGLISRWPYIADQQLVSKEAVAVGWAALRCLPHACEKPQQVSFVSSPPAVLLYLYEVL